MSGKQKLDGQGVDQKRYVEAFVAEADELVNSLGDLILRLEKSPQDRELIDEIFRSAHSLKGMSATMRYETLAGLTHSLENVLELVRQERQPVTEELIAVFFNCVDAIEEGIRAVSEGADAPDFAGLVEVLSRFDGGESRSDGNAAVQTGEAARTRVAPSGPRYRVSVVLEKSCVLKSVRAYMVVKRLNHIGEILRSYPSMEEIEDEKFDNRFEFDITCPLEPEKISADIRAISEIAEVEVDLIQGTGQARVAREKAPISANAGQTVRVSIERLDNLMNLVGELVINRSRLEEIGAGIDVAELEDAVLSLRRLTGDLQHEVMRTRMVPVGNIFNRFPRMIRDAAKELSKSVDFVISGGDIELDRTVLDEVGDPIVHLLRNAVGHGIESPEDRAAAGKPEAGVIKLKAAREKETVVIEVSDDGAGLDADKLRKKAVSDGILTTAEADALTETEVMELICRPGFSTAKEASALSGRGVGMDAVKGKIEALGGSLAIASELGRGTTFTLELPLTLAIIQALMVKAAGQTYALPLNSIVEVASLRIEDIQGIKERPVMMLHDKVVPLSWLAEQMGQLKDPPGRRSESPVAVIRSGSETRGLVVGRLLGRMEIVVKPLNDFFGARPGIGGITILGDGRPALVVDVRTLN